MKTLDFIKKKLHQKNEGRSCIDNVDEVIDESYRAFLKQIKLLPFESYLLDFTIIRRSKSEVIFVTVVTGLENFRK